jgi:GTP cyclohydrolase II
MSIATQSVPVPDGNRSPSSDENTILDGISTSAAICYATPSEPSQTASKWRGDGFPNSEIAGDDAFTDAVALARRATTPFSRVVQIGGAPFSVTRIGVGPVRLNDGAQFWLIALTVDDPWQHYLALTSADLDGDFEPQWPSNKPVTVRIDSGCVTGQVFLDDRCDCREQLHRAIGVIARDVGVIVSVPSHEGRGAGIAHKLSTLILADAIGLDTVAAAEIVGGPESVERRTYLGAIAVLRFLGLGVGTRLRFLSNNPAKIAALVAHGFDVERVPVIVPPTALTAVHLAAKAAQLGHLLHV